MKLSIIIPIYNVAPYLSRCIESCELQLKDTHDFEILVIDDGSTDESIVIIAELKRKYDNIYLISQENSGQASARNKGLFAARGDYIWFVDGDDYLTCDGIETLLNEAIELDLDVQAFNLQFVDERQNVSSFTINAPAKKNFFSRGQDFICKIEMPHSPCIGLFRRKFLVENNLIFDTTIFYEDFELMPKLYCLAKKCQFTDEVHYNYFQRSGSTMKLSNKERNNKRCKDLLTIADSLYEFAITHYNKDTLPHRVLMQQVYFAVTQSLSFYSKKEFSLSEYKNKPYYPMSTSILSGFMKKKIMLANFSIELYLLLHNLMRKRDPHYNI